MANVGKEERRFRAGRETRQPSRDGENQDARRYATYRIVLPAKKAVMDEQIEKWFEQDVIEASRSPWSAPVVIVYRHGKPRFCVDYRKLNEHTIPDEFPIPRQSEILAAFSGAQLLSSLDALS